MCRRSRRSDSGQHEGSLLVLSTLSVFRLLAVQLALGISNLGIFACHYLISIFHTAKLHL